MKKIIIYEDLPSHNQYTGAIRKNRYKGGSIKRSIEFKIAKWINEEKEKGFRLNNFPVNLHLHWYCKDRRTDPDNITLGIKFILDALQKCGVIGNDDWKHVGEIHHYFHVDPENVRVEIEFDEPQVNQKPKKQRFNNDKNHSITRRAVEQKRKDTKAIQKNGRNARL